MRAHDRHGGDSITDFGFFFAVLLFLAGFIAVMIWLVPPLARWIAT